jgi:hypothetical protein
VATLIPAQPKDCTHGERLVYEKLGRDLPEDWIILHSLGLAGHETKLWGEADIVVLSTKGIFALEIKGGKVSCKDGVWTFGDPSKVYYTKLEDPWTQAKGTMYAVKNRLKQTDSRMADLLFGFGVVMPHETFTATGAEIESAVLLDKRDIRANLGYYIGSLQRHWLEAYRRKHNRDPRMPSRQEIRQIRQILRPDVDSAFSLGSYLTGVETVLVQLSNDQIRASRRMDGNPRNIVRGKAGTGKTVLATERALQLSARGLRVLFLCFNQLLAKHLKLGIAADTRGSNVEVRHVHSLYREVIDRAGIAHRLDGAADQKELFARVFPETFIDAALDTGLEPWDVLVVDEAQDLLTPENIDAFDLLLTDGINRGRWHIFFDRLQNIYGTEIQEHVEKRLAEAQPAFDDLFENCRNTRQVAIQASILSGIDVAVEGAPDGPICDNVYFRDTNQLEHLLDAMVARLLRQDIKPGDIAILSARKRENSLLAQKTSIAGLPLVDAANANSGDLVFSTMHAFKGLERLVVLAVDIDGLGELHNQMLHYAGFTRARGLLHVFLHESLKGFYSHQATLFSQRFVQGANQP